MMMSANDARTYGMVFVLSEIKEIESDIVCAITAGRNNITRKTLLDDTIKILEEKGYLVIQTRRYNDGGYIISW